MLHDTLGTDICLTCFNGRCLSPERYRAHTHSKKTAPIRAQRQAASALLHCLYRRNPLLPPSLPSFQKCYAAPAAVQHWASCTKSLPASFINCQMHKLADRPRTRARGAQ